MKTTKAGQETTAERQRRTRREHRAAQEAADAARGAVAKAAAEKLVGETRAAFLAASAERKRELRKLAGETTPNHAEAPAPEPPAAATNAIPHGRIVRLEHVGRMVHVTFAIDETSLLRFLVGL